MRPTEYTTHPRDSYPARLLRSLLSALIPGLGQLLAGLRRRGFLLLAVFVIVTGAAAFFLTRGVDAIVGWALEPRVLLGLLVVDIAVGLVRLYAVMDAWLTGKVGSLKAVRPSGVQTALTVVGLALVIVFTVAPHVAAGYYTVVSRDLITTVFTGADAETTTTAAPDSTSLSTTTSISASSTTPGSTSSSQTTQTSQTSTTSTTSTTTTTTSIGPSLASGDDGRMTVLLIGTDAGFGRTGARADSMNVATIDMATGRVALFGLPRNAINTPLGPKTSKALGMKTYPDLLNSLYTAGLRHPELAPDGDPGAEAVKETASIILGIQIDYYAVVNMLGLVDMVDAVGGVDINLKTALHITYAPLNPGEAKKSYVFKVGLNHLDGLQALAFARDRSDSDDYVRMGRQRCVLMGMLYQHSVASLTLRFPRIATALEKNVRTNLPPSALADLVKLRSKVKTSDMIAIGFTPPDWVTRRVGMDNVLDVPKIGAAVNSVLADPDGWARDHPAAATRDGGPDCWKANK